MCRNESVVSLAMWTAVALLALAAAALPAPEIRNVETAAVLRNDLRGNDDDPTDRDAASAGRRADAASDSKVNSDSSDSKPNGTVSVEEPHAPRKKVGKRMLFFDKFAARANRTGGKGVPREDADKQRAAPGARDEALPSALQLDMAPARGAKIQDMRQRNRLCHRHVLVPEGPKYDSRGRVYLAAFKRVRGRNYSETRAPSLLLPRCCNCCRKSALGCE